MVELGEAGSQALTGHWRWSGGARGYHGGRTGLVRVWDLASGEAIREAPAAVDGAVLPLVDALYGRAPRVAQGGTGDVKLC